MATVLFSSKQSNLREIDRIFSYARLALMQFSMNSYLAPDLYFMLCCWKVMDKSFYNKIKKHEFSIQELLEQLELKIPKCLIDDRISKRKIVLVVNDSKGPVSNLSPKILKKEELDSALNYYVTRFDERYENGLNYILKKIDLLESFKSYSD